MLLLEACYFFSYLLSSLPLLCYLLVLINIVAADLSSVINFEEHPLSANSLYILNVMYMEMLSKIFDTYLLDLIAIMFLICRKNFVLFSKFWSKGIPRPGSPRDKCGWLRIRCSHFKDWPQGENSAEETACQREFWLLCLLQNHHWRYTLILLD